MKHRWVIVHSPRTGGSSFRHLVATRLPGGYTEMFRDYAWHQLFLGDNFTTDTRVIYGHFRAAKYQGLLDQGWKLGTFVRDPIERLESHFKLIEGSRHLWRPFRLPIPANFFEFCTDPRFANAQSNYLDLPVDRFDFIGLTCKFTESLTRFDAANEVQGALVDCHINDTPKESLIEQLSTEQMLQVKAANAVDIATYHTWKTRYHQQA